MWFRRREREKMCNRQLLMHILEKMGYFWCFPWTTTRTTSRAIQLKNANTNTISSSSIVDNKNGNAKDTDFNSITLIDAVLSSPSGGSRTCELESRVEVSIPKDVTSAKNEAHVFNYRELATATNNFRSESFIGEGGFGPVYKGRLERTGQVVAVKKLNQTGIQGDKEFLVEVLMLSLLRHPNLVNLIGYCAEGNQRLLVYEYMPLGSLAYHLHDRPSDGKPLDWNTRMKIAAGAAEGLDYLHNQADPCVIYRDLKTANILLDDGFHPKLSDFGLAKFGPEGDKSHVSTRVMGTHGYCAPEYAVTGKLTKMSDIYSFGVVLLELITGQEAMDPTRGQGKQMLVEWAHPMLKDRKSYSKLVDPKLKGQFPEPVLCKAVEVTSMCLRENPHSRPSIKDLLLALKYLSSRLYGTYEVRNWDRKNYNEDDDHVNDARVYIVGEENNSDETNKDLERQLAVAEAKMWGQTWREKRRLKKK